ncbi:MAG: hypothetical protein R3297_07540 [Desulfobulbales bacterium]|nr:hypothetical protein [Desulfobulbales bacterium]
MEQKENKIPGHTRFGLRLLQVLIIIFCLVLVQRCIHIYNENRDVDAETRVEYFEKGFASGRKKSLGLSEDPEPRFKNYAYKKAYRDGYRQGWDSGREEEKQE